MADSSLNAANLFNVDGLVAVITGGGSGIGRMMTRALALNGAHKVYILGRREAALLETASSVHTKNVIAVVCDVTSKEALAAVVTRITAEVGYVNVLIANSGTLGAQATTAITPTSSIKDFQNAFWTIDPEDWQEAFTLNSVAVWYTIVAFLELLDKGNKTANVSQKSQVIATSSIGAFNRRVPGGYAYGQSKAATTHLMKQLATNLVPYDIRANVIAPGLFPSDMSTNILGQGLIPKEKVPLERAGTEEDMAGCILYLTSRAGAYVSGSVMVLDGGRLSIMPSSY